MQVLALAAALSGCTSIEHKPRGFVTEAMPATSNGARKIVIFFDGTANDEGSDTNIKRLHSLITLQDRGDIASLYLLGVGTDSDAIGAITGSGIGARVRIAYEFILNHYEPARAAEPAQGLKPAQAARPADEIYIFGFSRGAYSARILTTMLYLAGVVEEKGDGPRGMTSTELSKLVHEKAFPPPFHDVVDGPDRRKKLQQALAGEDLQSKGEAGRPPRSVPVKVLGLWDTVEALGFPHPGQHLKLALQSNPPAVNIDVPNGRYGERLCNVERAYHAVSIDDDRATIFTPLLLSRKHLFRDCPFDARKASTDGNDGFLSPMLDANGKILPGHLQEVWFSGAHADVGGGYLNSTLNGVSLNWMLRLLQDTDLLPKAMGTAPAATPPRYVREDVFGTSHDPASGLWAIPYPTVTRDIVAYATDDGALDEVSCKICVHDSVFTRRKFMAQKEHEYAQLKLTAPGLVELVRGPYGKGRQWEWRVERTSPDQPPSGTMEIQRYPYCELVEKMPASVPKE